MSYPFAQIWIADHFLEPFFTENQETWSILKAYFTNQGPPKFTNHLNIAARTDTASTPTSLGPEREYCRMATEIRSGPGSQSPAPRACWGWETCVAHHFRTSPLHLFFFIILVSSVLSSVLYVPYLGSPGKSTCRPKLVPKIT